MQMDINALNMTQQAQYLFHFAKNMGLDPMTRPFDVILTPAGKGAFKKVIYANRGCAEQLRKMHSIRLDILERGPLALGDELRKDVYVVKVRATLPDERYDEGIGAVDIGGLKGEELANAIMKCETKAKRRITLSIMGLGMLDELEVQTIPGAIHESGPGEIRRIVPTQQPIEAEVSVPPGPLQPAIPPVQVLPRAK